jgi:hypothetical protein
VRGHGLIARRLTGGPLTRQHERFLDGKERRRPPIAWARFDRARYPEAALRLAGEEARALAAGEYSAVESFALLTLSLASHAVPFDLVAASAGVPSDELRHAELALRFAGLCDGAPAEAFERREPALPPQRLSLEELDQLVIQLPVVSETLALAMLTECKDQARDPVARSFFGHLVADELHHARLGWYYLAWRAPQWTPAERQRAADWAASIVIEVERRFATGRDAAPRSRAAARALGVLDTPSLRRSVKRVMEEEIVPGLDALGLGGQVAWKLRYRAR